MRLFLSNPVKNCFLIETFPYENKILDVSLRKADGPEKCGQDLKKYLNIFSLLFIPEEYTGHFLVIQALFEPFQC